MISLCTASDDKLTNYEWFSGSIETDVAQIDYLFG